MFDLDLHLHSTASDGTLSPSQLINKCAESGLKVVALTDHDTLDGIDEAIFQANKLGSIEVIPGIEISCSWNGAEIHILGLFPSLSNSRLYGYCTKARKNRLYRSKKIVERLQQIGVEIEFEKKRLRISAISSLSKGQKEFTVVEDFMKRIDVGSFCRGSAFSGPFSPSSHA